MKAAILLTLALCSSICFAGGKPPPVQDVPVRVDNTNLNANLSLNQLEQGQHQQSSNRNSNDSSARSGDSIAGAAAISGDSISGGGNAHSQSGDSSALSGSHSSSGDSISGSLSEGGNSSSEAVGGNIESSIDGGDLTANTGDLSSSQDVDSRSGDNSVQVGGDTILNNDSYLALSLRFPQASGCFSGFQGGDSNGGRSSFLGFHVLNHDCWMNVLAQQEGDIELNARLKCHSKKYMDAVAYEKRRWNFLFFQIGRKAKQAECVDLVIAAGNRTIAATKAAMAASLLSAEKVVYRDVIKEVEGHHHKPNADGSLTYDGVTYQPPIK